MDQFSLEALEQWSQRAQPTYKHISVTPIQPTLGAEVEGVDLSRPLSDEILSEVRTAWMHHQVLVFRDQILTGEDHKRFGRYFGKLHVHPGHIAKASGKKSATGSYDYGGDPEILQIKADANSKFVAGEGWHTDVTCDVEPPMGSMLYITETPQVGGGDTLFANTYLAYEMLSPAMKDFLGGLSAIHNGAKPYSGFYDAPIPAGGWPQAEHPVIVSHPETGRKVLFVNSGFTTGIKQLSAQESSGLLSSLYEHIANSPELHCRVRWAPNTLTIWDNRCTQHHAVWNYYPHRRYGQRVSIIGERPQP